MIEIMTDLPDFVIGIRAKGRVTGEDYESVLIPAIEEKLKKHPKISLLYHIGTDFSDFEAAAMWDDAKIGLRHIAAWRKVAVVSDVDWIRWLMKVFAFVIPGDVRIFTNDQLAEAREWVSAD